MRKINKDLIEEDVAEEEATEPDDSEFITDEIISEADEQEKNALYDKLFDDESDSEDFDGEEEVTDEDVAEYTKRAAHKVSAERNEQERKVSAQKGNNINEDRNNASKPQANFQTAPSEPKNWMENLELILDIPLQIDIQLGQTKIPLREVLELSSGSIIKLNKSESDSVELLINGKLVAEGQIVVTNRNTLGVQVTSIVNRVERIRSLR